MVTIRYQGRERRDAPGSGPRPRPLPRPGEDVIQVNPLKPWQAAVEPREDGLSICITFTDEGGTANIVEMTFKDQAERDAALAAFLIATEDWVTQTMMREEPRELKRCPNNPAHIWMADVPFCPYCNISPDVRTYYDQKERDKERREKERGRK